MLYGLTVRSSQLLQKEFWLIEWPTKHFCQSEIPIDPLAMDEFSGGAEAGFLEQFKSFGATVVDEIRIVRI